MFLHTNTRFMLHAVEQSREALLVNISRYYALPPAPLMPEFKARCVASRECFLPMVWCSRCRYASIGHILSLEIDTKYQASPAHLSDGIPEAMSILYTCTIARHICMWCFLPCTYLISASLACRCSACFRYKQAM